MKAGLEDYNFANKLKEKLKEREMSQQQLANKTGINRATIADYVNARCDPSLKKYLIICNALQIEM